MIVLATSSIGHSIDCYREYDLRVVARSTVPDPERTPAMEANELRLWNRCTACHQELGESVYRFYLARRIERFEIKACSSLCKDEIGSFIALRRLVALLVQERVMLDMKDAALKAVGFDGAFIALGRTCVTNQTVERSHVLTTVPPIVCA